MKLKGCDKCSKNLEVKILSPKTLNYFDGKICFGDGGMLNFSKGGEI